MVFGRCRMHGSLQAFVDGDSVVTAYSDDNSSSLVLQPLVRELPRTRSRAEASSSRYWRFNERNDEKAR
jgi:hypothetical protein